MPEADLYCRVSTHNQKEEGSSLESQAKSCSELARVRGFQIAQVHSEDWPGTTLDRPQLRILRDRIRKGVIQAVICHATDRLARDPIHLAIVAEECEKHGVELVFVTEPLDNSPEGQLIRYVKGFAAKIEHEKIKERTVRGKRERVLSGKLPTGGVGLYGYGYDRASGKRFVNEDEAKIVRLIFHWLIDEDLTLGRICIRLTDMGIPSPRDTRHWGRSTIGRLVNQQAYTGQTYGLRWESVESKTHKGKRYKNNRRELRDKSEWIELPDATPQIIPPETFLKAQNVLERHRRLAPRKSKRSYLLSGMVRCGQCGRVYTISPHQSGNWYYRCSGHSRAMVAELCHNRTLNGSRLESQVWDKVKEVLLHPTLIIEEIQRRQNKQSDDSLEELLSAIENRLNKLKDQETRLAKLYVLGELDDDSIKAAGSSLRQEKKGLEEEAKKLKNEIESLHHLRLAQESIQQYCQQASERIEEFDQVDKRDALLALELSVIIFPDRIALRGLVPSGFVSQPS